MTPEWIQSGSGTGPAVAWSMRTEAEIIGTAYAREPGITYVGDETGSVYALDRHGDIAAVTRGFRDLTHITWADDGSSGAIVSQRDQVARLDTQLKSQWSANLPGEVLTVALDPYGHHLAIGMATRTTFILNWRNKRVCELETIRPLSYIRFSATAQQIIGAADQGHLCCHALKGEEIWKEQIFSNVGDMRITGDASRILLASFNHGVQMYDSEGSHRGSYMVDGTPKLIDSTFVSESVAVATIENHLYWLDADGEMKWATETDDEMVGLHCEPLGGGMIVAMKSGWIYRLAWESAA